VSLVYVTSRFPFGPGEAFLAPEISAHVAAGCDLRIFPMLPKGGLVHGDAAAFIGRTDGADLRRASAATVKSVVTRPGRFTRAAVRAGRSRSGAARMRNYAVLLRVGALIEALDRASATHVHAHWGGASSTLTMVAAEAVGIPWSMTLHRWDIGANNLLGEKIESACFTRVISRAAVADVRAIVPDADPVVIHMGVAVEARAQEPAAPRGAGCRLLNVANFVEVKNHRDLVESFGRLRDLPDVTLDLVGEGPLFPEIRDLVARLGLGEKVNLLGPLDHDELLRRLAGREWDGVVLTSAAAPDAHEGIPVSLMEAMAAGIPVLATDSGGTRELIGEEAGALVPAGDLDALTSGLARFVSDPTFRERIGVEGHRRVSQDFNAEVVSRELRRLIATCSA
jgi:colanic acid/amylovoran biosynthesis glycosyltransferase